MDIPLSTLEGFAVVNETHVDFSLKLLGFSVLHCTSAAVISVALSFLSIACTYDSLFWMYDVKHNLTGM